MNRSTPLVVVLFFLVSCTTIYQPKSVTYQGYSVSPGIQSDTALSNMLQPYAGEVRGMMQKVIGFTNVNMYRRQPESILGNFMADCMQQMAAQKYGRPVDVGFMNNGGIRSELQKGNITLGNIYELMPFDNLVVIQEIKGTVLEQFIQHIAADRGWPISKGSSYVIRSGKAEQIIINGKPLNREASYIVANSDYIAAGGSNAAMLKSIPVENKGYLLRDALVEYIESMTRQGRSVDGPLEKRVSIANE